VGFQHHAPVVLPPGKTRYGGWVGARAGLDGGEMNTIFQSENPKGLDQMTDTDVDGMIILKWILSRVRSCGLELTCMKVGNELSVYIQAG